ncbi:MAG: hypothetical protein LQ344_001414 [Seirophora lacunosa]|nr:MAG: hypothetical protein LQ344_001414 [Seirophora lacunosa]
MDSPTESLIDDMIARATVETWGDGREITPSPDPEEDDAEIRVIEAQARQDLERDGCPPCYPPHIDVPARNPPEEYEQIVGYWQSFTSTDDVVLGAQRADWESFGRLSEACGTAIETNHSTYLLTSLGKDRDEQQKRYDDFPRRLRQWQEKNRDDTQKKAGHDVREQGFEHVATCNLEYAKRSLRWHEAMLCWIAQRRLAMDPPPQTPVKEGGGDQNLSSIRQRGSTRPITPAVLNQVRVSKSTPKRQNIRTRATKAATLTPIPVDSALTIPSSTQQTPRRRETKPRRAKEKALGQLLPQRVAKPTRSAGTGTKSRSRTQCSGDGRIRDRPKPQRRSATQRLQPTPGIIKTRSQRISREPVRWVPG